jgi:hypothetical protein
LFFDFDCKEDLNKAWTEARTFADVISKYYKTKPLIAFSGNKGYHVYIFLENVLTLPTWSLAFVKQIYETLQNKLLRGLKFETLDPVVVGDIKRLARIPYTVHEESNKLCVPLTTAHQFMELQTLDIFRESGLNTDILNSVCQEVESQNYLEQILAKSRVKHTIKFNTNHRIRPCIETAVGLPLHNGTGHKMRIAIVAEYSNKDASLDQIVDLFRTQIDFGDGSKTRYYVQNLIRKKYKPFKCKTIQELGFCLGNSCPTYKRIGGKLS